MYVGFFCDIFSLSIATCLQRNIPWMSWTKKIDEKLEIMNEVIAILSEKDKDIEALKS